MTRETALALLASLLERLDSDAGSESPRLSRYVSASETEALRFFLSDLGAGVAPHEPPIKAAEEKGQAESAARVGIPSSLPSILPPSPTAYAINEKAFSILNPSDADLVLCLDFGTAKSKAFAGTAGDDFKLLELGLGQRDGDLDGAIYAVSSSVWIDDDGLMFAGSEAVKRSMYYVDKGVSGVRMPLLSLKQELSQIIPGGDMASRPLSQAYNPSGIGLSYDHAITFYLAFLTDLATTELEEKHGRSRYIKRRFTLPCWKAKHRSVAAHFLSERLACAQVLADTFHGRWTGGIHTSEFKKATEAVLLRKSELSYLLDFRSDIGEEFAIHWGGLLEPLAAGSCRLWSDRGTRDLVMILDVGAGTTDFSLFWVVQNVEKPGHRAFPVKPFGTTIRSAGDTLDSLLVEGLLTKANLGADPELKQRVSAGIYRGGIRRLKEMLLTTGELSHRLVNDQVVSISREEFLNTEGVRRFTSTIEAEWQNFLNSIDDTWRSPLGSAKLVLTGGGCDLPMVKMLACKTWEFRGTSFRFQPTLTVPDFISQHFAADFAREYPQLAVALGGALPSVLDELRALDKWAGGTPPPGPLTRFPITGA